MVPVESSVSAGLSQNGISTKWNLKGWGFKSGKMRTQVTETTFMAQIIYSYQQNTCYNCIVTVDIQNSGRKYQSGQQNGNGKGQYTISSYTSIYIELYILSSSFQVE